MAMLKKYPQGIPSISMIHFDWKLGPPAKASWGSAEGEGAHVSIFSSAFSMVTIDRTWEPWYPLVN